MKRTQDILNLINAKAPWEKKSPAEDFIQGTFWEMTKNAYIKLPKEEQFNFLKHMFPQKEKEAN